MNKTASISKIEITLENVSYPFYLGYGVLEELVVPLSHLEPDKIVVVSDRNVWDIYRQELLPVLNQVAPVIELITMPGEDAKSLGVLECLAETALQHGISRKSVIVAFGGGVPGNLGGLLAALLFRGIRLVHIPTSVVAILDSVVSLKQAVNSKGGKNLFGTYYCASFVWADIQYLNTLSEKDFRSGLCEVVKNVLAIQPEQISWLQRALGGNYRQDPDILEEMIRIGVAAKLKVMARDKYEKKDALILEYGHTIGHAVEILNHRRQGPSVLSHGEAVAIGMTAAALIAEKLEFASKAVVDAHRRLIELTGVATRIPVGLTANDILEVLHRDNKKGYLNQHPNHISMILLKELGVPVMSGSLPLYPVPVECIRSVLNKLLELES